MAHATIPLHQTLLQRQYDPSSVLVTALGTGTAPLFPIVVEGVLGDFWGDFAEILGDSILIISLGIIDIADLTTMLLILLYCFRFNRNFQNSERSDSEWIKSL